MDRQGHCGVALALYSPIAFSLIRSGFDRLTLVGLALVLATAMLPDLDLRVSFLSHRGITHTVWFAALVGGLFAAGFAQLGPAVVGPAPADLRTVGFALGAFTVCAHVCGDALTPMGVRPFAPLWRGRFTARLARGSSPAANLGLFALGVVLTAAAYLQATVGLVVLRP